MQIVTPYQDVPTRKSIGITASETSSFEWRSNPAVQGLLDVVIRVLVTEYATILKAKPASGQIEYQSRQNMPLENIEEKRGAA